MAPPPTRGSTRCPRDRPRLPVGSPAHAGIDPSEEPIMADMIRLPRPRGDRPWKSPPALLLGLAPPPTRGSTHELPRRHARRRGSPAHAGIDPHHWATAAIRGGLPRPRGDRPYSKPKPDDPCQAPPPTRGSTRHTRIGLGSVRGSPAHAGIDPHHRAVQPLARWLPRPRGDRPFLIAPDADLTPAPPPTRGSTHDRRAVAECDRGSPAHAGIDPRWPGCRWPRRRAPPPTRGSTLPGRT